MSTRGATGFRIKGQDKVTYNHCDSYPSGLGQAVLDAIGNIAWDDPAVRKNIEDIRVVNEGSKPTPEDVKALEVYTNMSVSNRSTDDWYCIMREMQGDLLAYLSVGVMTNGLAFLRDSLFCEYAYIVNVDEGTLEFYVGFNKDRNAAGRYAALAPENEEYAGVRLAQTIPIADIVAEKVAINPEFKDAAEDLAFIYPE